MGTAADFVKLLHKSSYNEKIPQKMLDWASLDMDDKEASTKEDIKPGALSVDLEA